MKTKQFNSMQLNSTESSLTTRTQNVHQCSALKITDNPAQHRASLFPMLQHQRPYVVTHLLVVLVVRTIAQWKLHIKQQQIINYAKVTATSTRL